LKARVGCDFLEILRARSALQTSHEHLPQSFFRIGNRAPRTILQEPLLQFGSNYNNRRTAFERVCIQAILNGSGAVIRMLVAPAAVVIERKYEVAINALRNCPNELGAVSKTPESRPTCRSTNESIALIPSSSGLRRIARNTACMSASAAKTYRSFIQGLWMRKPLPGRERRPGRGELRCLLRAEPRPLCLALKTTARNRPLNAERSSANAW
jgi:hypothetical protein